MAAPTRKHWRFVVRDQYGYVIQNAKVNVYQPGTSNSFTGSAYNAASGGSTVTNPFTTNSQGEVEAWFDNAQPVDVQVDDNTDTAYRAVNGASAVVSFTTFTEADEIHIAPADQGSNDAGEAGDIAVTLVNPFTAVTAAAGATGEWADAAHVHPYTALTPAAPVLDRTTAAAGSLTNPARSDHIHGIGLGVGRTSKLTSTSDTNEQEMYKVTVPANTLTAGSTFLIWADLYQTNSTTAITYTFRVRWGGLAGVVVGNTLTLVGTTTAHTDNPVHLRAMLTFQSIGGTGAAQLDWSGDECITTATANTPKLILGAQTAAATVDTTANKDLSLTAQMNLTTGTPNWELETVNITQVA